MMKNKGKDPITITCYYDCAPGPFIFILCSKEMASSSNRVVFPKAEPSKELVPLWPEAEDLAPFKLRAMTNLVPFKPIRLYIPDDIESVPKVFALGRHLVQTAGGDEETSSDEEMLLSGYFSALCAVLPEGLDIAKRILENLSYRVSEVKIPSEARACNIFITPSSGLIPSEARLRNIVIPPSSGLIPSEARLWNIVIPPSSDLKLETINFALLCILPFQDKPEEVEAEIVRRVTTKFEFNFSSHNLCQGFDMKTLRTALSFSGLSPLLRRFIAESVRALATTSTPLGCVLSQVTNLCGD